MSLLITEGVRTINQASEMISQSSDQRLFCSGGFTRHSEGWNFDRKKVKGLLLEALATRWRR